MRIPLRAMMLATAISIATQAYAQDVVVMRRTVAPPNMGTPKDTQTQPPTGTAGGSVNPGSGGSSGGTPASTNPTPTPGSTPSPTPTPTYRWHVIGVTWDSTCSDDTWRNVQSVCTDDASAMGSGLHTVPDEMCDPAKKPQREKGSNLTTCVYEWRPNDWGDWSSTCSAKATRERTQFCLRIDPATAATKPAGDVSCSGLASLTLRSAETENFTGCGYSWKESDVWTTTSLVCGKQTETHDVWCERSDGTRMPKTEEYRCTQAKPSLTRETPNDSACPKSEWRITHISVTWDGRSFYRADGTVWTYASVDCYSTETGKVISGSICTTHTPRPSGASLEKYLPATRVANPDRGTSSDPNLARANWIVTFTNPVAAYGLKSNSGYAPAGLCNALKTGYSDGAYYMRCK